MKNWIYKWVMGRKGKRGIASTIYYVSGDGNDLNSGKHPLQPWRTIDRLNLEKKWIWPEDQVLFRRGFRYWGHPFYLDPKCSKAIKVGAYGGGSHPVFPDVDIKQKKELK